MSTSRPKLRSKFDREETAPYEEKPIEGNRAPNQSYVDVVRTIEDFRGWPLYLFGRGGEVDGLLVEADIFDDLWRRSKGKVPLEIDMVCPRCNRLNRIHGDHKTIRLWRKPKPEQFAGPTGALHVQTFVMTVEEPMTCDQPALNGKGNCGFRFVIRENVFTRA